MKNLFSFIFIFFLFAFSCKAFATADSIRIENPKPVENGIKDYQIFLKHPAKQIKLIMYEKNFLPIQGKLSEDKKSVIMKDYQTGNKVRLKVVYEDGTEEEIIKSPCYIDPVVL